MAVWSPSRSRSYHPPWPDRWRRPSSARPAPRRASEHAMVNGEIASVCCRHPDLVAVYEAPDGGLALLLRQTLVPLGEERGRWFNDTRRAAHAAVASLRAGGVTQDVPVLQWGPPPDVATILEGWRCRYLGDSERYVQLADIVGASLGDRKPAGAVPHCGGAEAALSAAALAISPTLLEWYRDMAPCWLAVESPVRRRLILRTHHWNVEGRPLAIARGGAPAAAGLRPTGRLVCRLGPGGPPGEPALSKTRDRPPIRDPHT